MAPNPDRIWLLANAVKDAIIDGYATAGVVLPERQFISGGVPAWDCELLAVQVEATFGHAGNITTETLDPQLASAGHTLRAARFALHLVRCGPTVDAEGSEILIPEVADEEAYAEAVLVDAQLLPNVIVAAQRAGDLPRCNGVALEGWTNVGLQGGLGGGIQRLRLGLE